jgi:uncharacterized membrane protein YphA (DoxX/SURF4 family)
MTMPFEKYRFSRYAILLLRLFLGGVFVYASWDKLFHPLEFARAMVGYQILPERVIGLAATTLPFLELICGILLLLGIWPMATLSCLGMMLVVFLAAIGQAAFRGLSIDCGCFTVEGKGAPLGWFTVLRDLALFLVWAIVFFAYWKRQRSSQEQFMPARPAHQEDENQ